ncbi:MAG: site-specific DNA-methyltransferase [Thermodesulfobacteriota bacterium]|nr:site-specific DNA-methyltransferase [Thermodesulfobacteriota bacterium]
MNSFEKLKTKLSELFQLDQADLDFGIYRIMNARREEINRFLERDLLPQVREAFGEYKSSDKAEIQKELDRVVEGVKAAGMDPDQSPKVKELRRRLAAEAVDVRALENDVYDHLYSFFSRYYHEGDFITLRRYKEGVYAIPYEGEEVKLHWANHDQYYIKTAEYFRDYTFKTPSGHRVHFKIVEADTEKDNIKAANGNDRRFLLNGDNPVTEENEELVIRFQYRPDGEKSKQDVINVDTANCVIADLSTKKMFIWQKRLSSIWKRADGKQTDKTILDKHLFDYTRRNTFDYFIHKDLDGFLRRELDFYIKNEVMRLDDVEEESAPRVEQYLSKIKVIRRIAHKIIDFLAQIENFQKKLWLKKKFVIETNYCITLDRVPEELYPEIAVNDDQREEWVRLFAINEIKKERRQLRLGEDTPVAYSEPLTVEFLKANQFLVLDTKFFGQEFKDKLLASFDEFDKKVNGILIHTENFQALSLMQSIYSGQLQCIHIDPPYNTQTSGFLYKNEYEHSSWLAMMTDRIKSSSSLMSGEGTYLCHIDENEYERLQLLFDDLLIPNAGTIAWDKRNPMNAGRGVATQHEYIVCRSLKNTPIYLRNKTILSMLRAAEEILAKHGGVIRDARTEYAAWINANSELSGGEKAYRYLDDHGRPYQSVSLRAPEPRTDPKFFKPLMHPITGKPCAIPPNGFSRTPETLDNMVQNGEIIFGKDEKIQPRQKVLLTNKTRRQLSSLIQNAEKGKADLSPLDLDFPYCHPVSLYKELVGSIVQTQGDKVLDFFAGSGTTGHAVIDLNREDSLDRRYILVEMGEHFNTTLKPRIQKVVYSKDWKDGKPLSREGISHMFKYIRLESYEDALANIELQRSGPQQLVLDKARDFRESYMLKYMLDVESRGSQTLLNIDNLDDPWNYKLLVGAGSVGETKPVNVDLVETFNWLLGLKVKRINRISGFQVIEGENPKAEKVLIIWRKIRDLTTKSAEQIMRQRQKSNEALDEFFKKQQYNTLDSDFDLIYVNGDNNLMNVPLYPEKEGVAPRYKVRLIEEAFKQLMFDVKDV